MAVVGCSDGWELWQVAKWSGWWWQLRPQWMWQQVVATEVNSHRVATNEVNPVGDNSWGSFLSTKPTLPVCLANKKPQEIETQGPQVALHQMTDGSVYKNPQLEGEACSPPLPSITREWSLPTVTTGQMVYLGAPLSLSCLTSLWQMLLGIVS